MTSRRRRLLPPVMPPQERTPAHLAYWAAKHALLPAVRLYRRLLPHTLVVAVTGSSGKTTTKDLLAAVLGTAGPVTAGYKTRNRAKGIIRVFAETRPHHWATVHEAAAWGPDTMEEVLWPLEPDVGVVTSVGLEHLKTFRTVEAVAEEKAKLVRALPADGLAVLNADDPAVRAMAAASRARVVLVGRAEDADLRAVGVRARWPEPLRFTAVRGGERFEIETRLFGEHWLPSVLAALAVGLELGVDRDAAVAAIAAAPPERHRLSEARFPDGVTFLEDDWKAPGWSLEAAFDVLRTARARRRVLVLGQISDDSRKPRRLLLDVLAQAAHAADLVIVVGRLGRYVGSRRARAAAGSVPVHGFPTARGAHEFLAGTLRDGDLVLVKASAYQEHLERLVLARGEGVACWRTDCGIRRFCYECRYRWRPAADGGAAG